MRGVKALENGFPLLTSAGMGRPPLGLKPTTVRLSAETIARIEAVAGRQRQLAVFIREAVENELRRRERERADTPSDG